MKIHSTSIIHHNIKKKLPGTACRIAHLKIDTTSVTQIKESDLSNNKLSFSLVGNTITSVKSLLSNVNGITISPKKSFCIIKIWMCNCEFQNPSKLIIIKGLNIHGCLFKKHNPEY